MMFSPDKYGVRTAGTGSNQFCINLRTNVFTQGIQTTPKLFYVGLFHYEVIMQQRLKIRIERVIMCSGDVYFLLEGSINRGSQKIQSM